mgnify:CR=1 FL=1
MRIDFEPLGRARERFPIPAGVADGLLALVAIGFILGFGGRVAALPAWTLLAWGGIAFRRSVAWQVSAALVLAVGTDIGSGQALGASWAMFGVAMLAANGWTIPNDERGDLGHGVFSGVGAGAGLMFSFVTAIVFGGSAPGWQTFLATFVVLLMSMGAVGIVFEFKARARRKEPRLAAKWSS